MKVEVREASKSIGETSGAGDSVREEKGYEIGAEIEGVWIPFASVNQSQVDHAKQRQDYADEQAKASGKQPASSKSDEPAK